MQLHNLAVGRNVVGAVQIPLVDLLARNERVDLDGVSAVDRKGIEFVVIHQDVGVFRVFVAPALVFTLDRFPGDLIDQLLAQSVAGLLIDLAKRDPLGS
jgi:hypothetical protein